MSDTKTKEPLIRIIKRDRSSFGYKVWVRAAAIILAEASRQRLAAGNYNQPSYSPDEYAALLEEWLKK